MSLGLSKIIHVDMDAFYASIEQRDNAELRGRPVVVGGQPDSRGVVAAASYEARVFGIRSAMPCAEAYRRCRHAVFVAPRMQHYVDVGRQLREIFRRVTPLVEPLSLDEAYLDVTENYLEMPLARDVARWLKATIRQETGLVASAGVGPSKLIAKIASDLDKPDGLAIIPPENVAGFLETLPVEKLWSVGPATAKKLHALGIRTAGQLRELKPEVLARRFGKHGLFLHGLASGRDDRRVTPHREPKSKGSERTFAGDVVDVDVLIESLTQQAERVAGSLRRIDRKARTVTLKVRYSDFTTLTRSQTLASPTDSARVLTSVAAELLVTATKAGVRPVRLIGLSASGFASEDEPRQLELPL